MADDATSLSEVRPDEAIEAKIDASDPTAGDDVRLVLKFGLGEYLLSGSPLAKGEDREIRSRARTDVTYILSAQGEGVNIATRGSGDEARETSRKADDERPACKVGGNGKDRDLEIVPGDDGGVVNHLPDPRQRQMES